ncbi:MAG: SprT-like domain-containing protein [Planctomycetota bacterium]
MDLPSAGQLAHHLMQTHGLPAAGWTFRFNQRKRTLGLCNFTAKRLELSAPFVTRNDEPQVRDVILHEIAHALNPPPESPPEPPPPPAPPPRPF